MLGSFGKSLLHVYLSGETPAADKFPAFLPQARLLLQSVTGSRTPVRAPLLLAANIPAGGSDVSHPYNPS